ncbi:MAG: amidohydrolase [Acidisphaera sp.]|nr:amidohydrolase [Acidisphaera sp.]
MNEIAAPRTLPRADTGSRMAIADCDIHPTPNSLAHMQRYLEPRWRRHLDTFGALRRHGCLGGSAYPKGSPGANRRDAAPPNGAKPGGDLDFMRAQHLDPNNVQLGILNMISPHPGGVQNPGLSAALSAGLNDWQVAEWTLHDKRLRASVLVPYEQPVAAAAEIDRRAGDANFAQILLLSRTAEPLGQRRYWPIYEAAVRAALPVAVHAFGYGGAPLTSSGWPSFYIEEMIGHASCCQSVLTSFIIEGVFEQFPALRVMLVESGFAWVPSLAWRLDKNWMRLREENPCLKRLPSEVLHEHVWFTTQPMEEPEESAHLLDVMEWIGWDRLLFATDYPHWDYDDPARCLPVPLSATQKAALFYGNARSFFRMD